MTDEPAKVPKCALLASQPTPAVSDEMVRAFYDAVPMVSDFDEIRAGLCAALSAPAAQQPSGTAIHNAITELEGHASTAYCNYINRLRGEKCLGVEHKLQHGKFGSDELEAHCKAREQLGAHRALQEAANVIRSLLRPVAQEAEKPAVAWLVDGRLEQGLTFDRDAANKMAAVNCGTVRPLVVGDAWHEAVLNECMRVESCYISADPAKTLANLINWHVRNGEQEAAREQPAKGENS